MPITAYQFLIASLSRTYEGDECLIWPYGKRKAGYGVVNFYINGRNRPRGERANSAKLNPALVAEIRALCAQGLTTREIAARYSVSHHTIVDIKNFKTWRW